MFIIFFLIGLIVGGCAVYFCLRNKLKATIQQDKDTAIHNANLIKQEEKSIIKEEDARGIRLQTALSFSRIAKACPNFNETLFGGEKNFKQRDFADISKNYITPNACFSLKKNN